jgi:hypothetical protein
LSALEIGNGVGRRKGEVFCKNTEYLETGLSFKKGTFLVRVSSQRGNIFQQVFLSKDNFSQKRNTSGQGVLFIRKNISRECFRSKKECLEQGLFLTKRERVFFQVGYFGTRLPVRREILGNGL